MFVATPRRWALLIVGALLVGGLGPSALRAQTPRSDSASSPAAVDAITPEALRRELAALAADSLHVDQVPSPALSRRAQYVAARFRELGLQPAGEPGGEAGPWLQSFPVPGQERVALAASQLRFLTYIGRGDAKIVTEAGDNTWRAIDFSFAATARLLAPQDAVFPWGGLDQPVVVLAGRQTLASVAQAALADKLIIYVPAADAPPALRRQILDTLQAVTQWVVVADDQAPADFRRSVDEAQHQPPALIDAYLHPNAGPKGLPWTVAVQASALAECLAIAGFELTDLRTAPTPIVHELPLASLGLGMQAAPAAAPDAQARRPAVNVLGQLEGADARVHTESLVITGSLDEASGSVAGLLVLAQALQAARAQGRLRRSVVFVAVTEGSGQWGTKFFVAHHPTVAHPVLHLTVASAASVDVGARTGADTVLAVGAADLELTPPLRWLPLNYPALALTVIDSATAFTPMGAGFPFVATGIPSVALQPWRRAARAVPSPSAPPSNAPSPAGASALDLARTVQRLRLAYYLAEAVANGDHPPTWTAQGRQRLAELEHP